MSQQAARRALNSAAPGRSPGLPGRVVAGESDVSSEGQGQGEEYLGGRVQPHPGALQDPQLEGDGDPWSTDRPPARCLLVQTVPSVPGTLPRAMCPPRLRDSLGPHVRSVRVDTASLGSPLLTQNAPWAHPQEDGPLRAGSQIRGVFSSLQAGGFEDSRAGRGPLHTDLVFPLGTHRPHPRTHQGARPGRQGLSCAAPGAPEAVEWPRGPLLAGSCSWTSPSEMWGLGPCGGHQGPQQASPPHPHFTRPHIPGRILLCSPPCEPDP